MNCIVTGGAGFIGSNIVDFLLSQGHVVTVIDNESSDAHESFYWNDKAKNYKLDICDYDAIFPLFKNIDVVFHLAAESRIQPTILDPIKAVKVNTLGTCNILQAARLNGVKRVVYSSTSSAYGLKNSIPLKESMKKDCLNAYSVSKTAGEELCAMYYSLYGLETVAFRYFNVYGERQPTRGQYAPVIGLFLKQKAEGNKMTVVGDGLQTRDYTHVSDVVQANYLAATTDNSAAYGDLFNVGTGKCYSVLDLVNIIGGEFVHIPARLGECRETLADNNKIKKILGWDSRVDLTEWINANK
jgi:UDP-glucose 4-epimerase